MTAHAQQQGRAEGDGDPGARLEEIVVTATRREGRVQDVPVAVTALDGTSLKNLGIAGSEDLQYVVPGLQTQGGFSNTSPQWNIRGIGSNGFFANDVGGVGIYLDDVFLNSNVGQGFQLFDTERVEVLRGPQGTLFGANTTGGAIQFVSRRPTGDAGASATVTVGNYGTRQFEAAGEVPLSDSSALRVAALMNENEGFFRNHTLGVRDGVTDIRSWRATYAVDFSDAAAMTIRVWGGDSSGDELVNFQQGAYEPANPGAGIVCSQPDIDAERCVDRTGYSESQTYSDFYDHEAETPATSDVRSRGASVTLQWQLDAIDVTSITAWYQAKRSLIDDIDGSADVNSSEQWDSSSDQYTQEVRLSSRSDSSLQWVGGVFVMREDMEDSYLFNVMPDGFWRDYDSETSSASAFGQLDYAFTDALSATAGVRYSQEKREFSNYRADVIDQSNYRPGQFLTREQLLDQATASLLAPTARSDDWSALSGRLSLNWRVSSDVLAYASAARGFRAGNFNGGAFSLSELTTVDPEYATTTEIGVKSEFLDGRARLNIAAFHSDYSDLQVVTTRDGVTNLSNAADATIKGGEIEFSLKPTRELLLSANVAILRAEYDTFLSSRGDFSGNELENSPHQSFQTLAQYEVPVGGGDKRLRFQVDGAYKGEVFQDFSNKIASIQEAYWLVGARIAYGPADDSYDISLWGRNLGDTEYRRNWFDVAGLGFNGINKGAPRTYGITFSIRL